MRLRAIDHNVIYISKAGALSPACFVNFPRQSSPRALHLPSQFRCYELPVIAPHYRKIAIAGFGYTLLKIHTFSSISMAVNFLPCDQ
jgi:hypothetical protein